MAASKSCSLTIPANFFPFSTTGTAPNPSIINEAITSPFVLRRTHCTSFSITCLTVMESKSLTLTTLAFFLAPFVLFIIPPYQLVHHPHRSCVIRRPSERQIPNPHSSEERRSPALTPLLS